MMDRSRGQSAATPEVTPAPIATQGGPAQVSYRQQIQPLLDRECVGCHGGQIIIAILPAGGGRTTRWHLGEGKNPSP
jgi:mono/diheme cytochrome c family protein